MAQRKNSAAQRMATPTDREPVSPANDAGDSLAERATRSGSVTIDWALHGEAILLEDMRLDLCRPHVLVPEQFLHRPDVRSVGQQVSGKGMSKRVTTGVLWDT